MANRFYITTPIYYANDVPHIGHTGTTVYADVVARYQRLLGNNVFFLTGTDEHGEKVAKAAENAGKTPQQFVNELAVEWRDYWKKLNISNDQFMRTTMDGHKKIAQELLFRLKNNGAIYKGVYKGIYCWGCEEFKSEKDLVDGKCPEHRPDQVEYREEENYFFKLSEYIPAVRKAIEDGTLPIIPENKRGEMLARISEPVDDLSVSRQNVAWGIPLPWDTSQTTYVWVEALMNYYSATKIWGMEEYWPANVHFLGKGNNWFHSVIWPALLLALGLPLPKKVFVHGYFTVDGCKMGKSLGNVISPQELMDRYGVDGTRYLITAAMPYLNDSDVSFKWFTEKYNADLANGLGNLVARTAKLAEGYSAVQHEPKLKDYPAIQSAYEDFRLHDVISECQALVKAANEYLNQKEPWKQNERSRKPVLNEVIKKILTVNYFLSPVMPDTSDKILAIFSRGPVKSGEILFGRI